MHDYDFDAVIYDGHIFCVGCLPRGVHASDECVEPIFACAEWDSPPVCEECGEVHEYMSLPPKKLGHAIGDEVYWNDPDEGKCSGVYKIKEFRDLTVVVLGLDDGTEVEAFFDEVE